MSTRKVPASYQVIDLVREAIGTPYVRASDAAVARALGITPGAVGGYKSGREFMSASTLEKAQEFMQLPDRQLAELYVRISMEAAKDRGSEKVWQALLDSVRGAAASVLLGTTAMLAHVQDARTTGNVVFQATSPARSGSPGMYIMFTRIRRFLRQLATIPAFHIATA